eukprot:3087114-Rhodomonas_salina.2
MATATGRHRAIAAALALVAVAAVVVSVIDLTVGSPRAGFGVRFWQRTVVEDAGGKGIGRHDA